MQFTDLRLAEPILRALSAEGYTVPTPIQAQAIPHVLDGQGVHEELGITIGQAHPWRIELVDYPHARVRLHFCKVFDWHGEFEMREQQAMAWQTLPVAVQPVLPGTIPVLEWFAAERGFSGATHAG